MRIAPIRRLLPLPQEMAAAAPPAQLALPAAQGGGGATQHRCGGQLEDTYYLAGAGCEPGRSSAAAALPPR
jgi:hypothetical protein